MRRAIWLAVALFALVVCVDAQVAPRPTLVTTDAVAINAETDTQSTIVQAAIATLGIEAGTRFTIVSAATSSHIPNNTLTAGAITAASTTGIVRLVEIVTQCDGTGWAGAGVTNFEFAVDNANGKTGASAPILAVAKASFAAQTTYVSTPKALAILETGKKVYVLGDAGAGTGAGICNVYMTFERGVDGATITAVNP